MSYHERIQVGLDRLGFTRQDYERLGAKAQRTQAESGDWFGWFLIVVSLHTGKPIPELIRCGQGNDHPKST